MSSVGYAEIQIEACSGEQQSLAFRRDTWRDSRTDANQAVSPIYAIALGGKPMKDYQEKHPWSQFFSDTGAHHQGLGDQAQPHVRESKAVRRADVRV